MTRFQDSPLFWVLRDRFARDLAATLLAPTLLAQGQRLNHAQILGDKGLRLLLALDEERAMRRGPSKLGFDVEVQRLLNGAIDRIESLGSMSFARDRNAKLELSARSAACALAAFWLGAARGRALVGSEPVYAARSLNATRLRFCSTGKDDDGRLPPNFALDVSFAWLIPKTGGGALNVLTGRPVKAECDGESDMAQGAAARLGFDPEGNDRLRGALAPSQARPGRELRARMAGRASRKAAPPAPRRRAASRAEPVFSLSLGMAFFPNGSGFDDCGGLLDPFCCVGTAAASGELARLQSPFEAVRPRHLLSPVMRLKPRSRNGEAVEAEASDWETLDDNDGDGRAFPVARALMAPRPDGMAESERALLLPPGWLDATAG